MGVEPLMNNTTKTTFDEDLVKICPAAAEQSCQNKETQNSFYPLWDGKISISFRAE